MAFDPNSFSQGINPEPPPRERRRGDSTFDPTEFIGDLSTAPAPQTYEPTAENLATTAALGAGGAAATAYGMSGPAVTPRMAYDVVGRPMLQSTGQQFQRYVADPFTAGRDIAASKVAPGVIPAQIARGAAPEMGAQLRAITGQLPRGADVAADQLLRGLQPQDVNRLYADIQSKGLDRAMREFQAPQYLDDAGRAALQQVQNSFPTGMQRLGRAAGMLGRTVGRVAGPVGIGMAAYDLYQLGNWAYDKYQAAQADRDQKIREEAARRALQGQQ